MEWADRRPAGKGAAYDLGGRESGRPRLLRGGLELGLYLSGFAVAASGLLAVALTVEDARFTLFSLGATAAGFVVSWNLRRLGVSSSRAALAVLFLFALVVLLLYDSPDLLYLVAPPGALLLEDLRTGMAITLLVVLRSFIMVTPSEVLFCVIPSVALFGLIGGINIGPEIGTLFFMFMLSSISLGGYHYALSRQEAAQKKRSPQAFSYYHFLASVGMFLALVVATFTLAVPLAVYAIPQRYPLGIAGGLWAPGPRVGLSDNPTYFRVGSGPITLSQQSVMEVRSDSAEYWRAWVYDTYTSHGWSASRSGHWFIGSQGENHDLTGLFPGLVGRQVDQAYRIYRSPGVLFGANQPAKVAIPAGRVIVDKFGVVYQGPTSRVVDLSYRVVSRVADFNTPPNPRAPQQVDDAYLRVPMEAEPRVVPLVERITAGLTSPERKVMALAGYLRSHYRYSLSAPAVPPDADVVDYFLFQQKEGYCDLFATALAVMARAAGIPARVATGYATGTFDPNIDAYLVKESDAHAWTEVFSPGRGWITVDATPGVLSQSAGTQRSFAKAFTWLRKYPMPAAILLLLGILGLYLRKGRWLDDLIWERQVTGRIKADDFRGLVIFNYARMLRLLAGIGAARHPWVTPQEYRQQLSQEAGLEPCLREIEALTSAFEQARYSAAPVEPEQADRSAGDWQRLKAGIKRKGPRARTPSPPTDSGEMRWTSRS